MSYSGLASFSACLLGVGLLGSGCSSGDEPIDFSKISVEHFSGLPPDSPLVDLNEQDFAALCQTTETYAERSLTSPLACRYFASLLTGAVAAAASSDAELQGMCQDFFDACRHGDLVQTPEAEGYCPNLAAGCTATVGEHEACRTQMKVVEEQRFDRAPACYALRLADLPLDDPTPPEPPACLDFFAKCPKE